MFLLQEHPPLRPLPAVSEISVSVTGIYLLGNKMDLSEVLSFEAAPGRQVLFLIKMGFRGGRGFGSLRLPLRECVICAVNHHRR